MRINLLTHGCCLAVILALSTWIVLEKTGDRHAVLQAEIAFALEHGSTEIKQNSNRFLRSEIIEYEDFIFSSSSHRNTYSLFKTRNQFQAEIDAILDSLSPNPNKRLAQRAQEHLQNYRSTVLELAGQESWIKEDMPQFPDSNWLVQAYEHDTPAGFAVILAEAKVNVAILEQIILIDIRQQTGRLERISAFMPLVSSQLINPQPGDSVTADVFLIEDADPSGSLTYMLNGSPLVGKGKTAYFEIRYDQPGLYPLRFSLTKRNWLTDSTEHVEKTYLLRVRE